MPTGPLCFYSALPLKIIRAPNRHLKGHSHDKWPQCGMNDSFLRDALFPSPLVTKFVLCAFVMNNSQITQRQHKQCVNVTGKPPKSDFLKLNIIMNQERANCQLQLNTEVWRSSFRLKAEMSTPSIGKNGHRHLEHSFVGW